MVTVEEKLENIERKLDVILVKLDKIEDENSNVSKHIDFINSVYSQLRHPLNFLTSKFGSKTLPNIKDK